MSDENKVTIEDLQKQVLDLQKDKTDLQAKVSDFENKETQYQTEKKDYETKLDELRKFNNDLFQRVQIQSKDVSENKQQKEAKKEDVDTLGDILKNLG